MAVGQAGFSCVLTVGGVLVGEARDVKINMSRGEVEDSARDTGGFRSFIPGLGEWSLEFMLLKKSPESSAMAAIRAAFLAGTVVEDVRMVDDFNNGWEGDVAVTNFSENQPYEDAVAIDVTFRGRGVPVQITNGS
jgi:predicted secreted protein